MDMPDVPALFRLLGDDVRLRLLRVLHAERLNVSELTGVLGLAQSGVSRHLGLLKDAELVEEDKDGGFTYYRLAPALAGSFPEKVTAFHDDMAVHGRFRHPCPVCGTPVQRIVYAENECNYCARCQTGGRLLADRSLSRLLKDDWPKSIDDI